MKLANYRSGMLRFSVSFILISIVLLSNLVFYSAAQDLIEFKGGDAYYTEQNATISGGIFDNCQEVPSCFASFEKIFGNGFENLHLNDFKTQWVTGQISICENSYESFELGQNSEGLRIAHYLKNCAIKIPISFA